MQLSHNCGDSALHRRVIHPVDLSPRLVGVRELAGHHHPEAGLGIRHSLQPPRRLVFAHRSWDHRNVTYFHIRFCDRQDFESAVPRWFWRSSRSRPCFPRAARFTSDPGPSGRSTIRPDVMTSGSGSTSTTVQPPTPRNETSSDVQYNTFNGIPLSVNLSTAPYTQYQNVNADMGIFAQDKWTLHRLTITGGIRFDYFNASIPAQSEPASAFASRAHVRGCEQRSGLERHRPADWSGLRRVWER